MTDEQRTASQNLLDIERTATDYAGRYVRTGSPADKDAYDASIQRMMAATAIYLDAVARTAFKQLGSD